MKGWKKVFETSGEEAGDLTNRIEIEGGYLYRNILILRGTYHVTITFVPFANRDSRIENLTEDELNRIEKLIFEGAQTHASILQCKADLKKLEAECIRLSKYISECDQARFENDNKLAERIDHIEGHLVI